MTAAARLRGLIRVQGFRVEGSVIFEGTSQLLAS